MKIIIYSVSFEHFILRNSQSIYFHTDFFGKIVKIETRENPKFSCEEKEKKEREKEIEERHRGREGE